MLANESISQEECGMMRDAVRDGHTFAEVAEAHDVIYDTVQYHVRDRCHHEVEPVPYYTND